MRIRKALFKKPDCRFVIAYQSIVVGDIVQHVKPVVVIDPMLLKNAVRPALTDVLACDNIAGGMIDEEE